MYEYIERGCSPMLRRCTEKVVRFGVRLHMCTQLGRFAPLCTTARRQHSLFVQRRSSIRMLPYTLEPRLRLTLLTLPILLFVTQRQGSLSTRATSEDERGSRHRGRPLRPRRGIPKGNSEPWRFAKVATTTPTKNGMPLTW